MVRVTFEKQGDKISLKLDGHAGQAATGQDIVCSSCSILAYTVAQIIKSEGENGSLKEKPIIILERGRAYISCRPKIHMYEELLHTYYVAEVGYTLLAHNYPEYVELEQFEI